MIPSTLTIYGRKITNNTIRGWSFDDELLAYDVRKEPIKGIRLYKWLKIYGKGGNKNKKRSKKERKEKKSKRLKKKILTNAYCPSTNKAEGWKECRTDENGSDIMTIRTQIEIPLALSIKSQSPFLSSSPLLTRDECGVLITIWPALGFKILVG